jgi:hypothetical protein
MCQGRVDLFSLQSFDAAVPLLDELWKAEIGVTPQVWVRNELYMLVSLVDCCGSDYAF